MMVVVASLIDQSESKEEISQEDLLGALSALNTNTTPVDTILKVKTPSKSKESSPGVSHWFSHVILSSCIFYFRDFYQSKLSHFKFEPLLTSPRLTNSKTQFCFCFCFYFDKNSVFFSFSLTNILINLLFSS